MSTDVPSRPAFAALALLEGPVQGLSGRYVLPAAPDRRNARIGRSTGFKHCSPPVAYSDYISTPRSSGYRGVHFVVNYSGRRIEIQLRTRVMHDWAITVERLSWRTRLNLKTDGDHPIQQLMSVISQAMAIEKVGGTVPDELLRTLTELRRVSQPFSCERRFRVSAIQHFLLVFDHEKGSLITERSFGSNSEAALAAYAECEREHRNNKLIEIVLIGSDSIETVRLTHANYFDGTAAVSKFLIGL